MVVVQLAVAAGPAAAAAELADASSARESVSPLMKHRLGVAFLQTLASGGSGCPH